MSAVEICLCILIIAGAFLLLSLGYLAIESAKTMKEVNKTTQLTQVTLKKADRVVEDITYKLELINAPFESVARLFDPRRPKFSFTSMFSKIFKK